MKRVFIMLAIVLGSAGLLFAQKSNQKEVSPRRFPWRSPWRFPWRIFFRYERDGRVRCQNG